jgi:hypothetical protein
MKHVLAACLLIALCGCKSHPKSAAAKPSPACCSAVIEGPRDIATNLIFSRHRVVMGKDPIKIAGDNGELQFSGQGWFDGEGNPVLPFEAYQMLLDMGFVHDPEVGLHVGKSNKLISFDGGGVNIYVE